MHPFQPEMRHAPWYNSKFTLPVILGSQEWYKWFWKWLGVLAQAVITEYQQLGSWKDRDVFLTVLESRMSETKVLVWFHLRALFLAYRWPPSFLGSGRVLIFHEHTDSIIRLHLMTSTKSNYLPKFPPPDTIMRAFRASAYELGELKHSICQNGLLKCMLEEIFAKYKNLQTLRYFYQYCYIFYWQVLKLFPSSLVSKETAFFLSTVQKK